MLMLPWQKKMQPRSLPIKVPSLKQVDRSPFPYKESYQSVIPLNIFQTWGTKELPPNLEAAKQETIRANPEFRYFLYDDNDCRKFLQRFFPPAVLQAYDRLVPGSYKADLWRCCILYIHGGIYLDMKFQVNQGFRLIALTEKEHFTMERHIHWMPGKHGIYNAFIVAKPRNPFLKKCIAQIVRNVQHRYYGFSPLYPTGPGMMWLVHETNPQIIGPHLDVFHAQEGEHILYKNRSILTKVPNYVNNNTGYYATLFDQKKIYHP